MNKLFAIPTAALATIAFLAATQSPADPAEIMLRSLEHESLNFDPPAMPNYTYAIVDEERKLNPDGTVKSVISETREVINLYGGHFERLIARNGQDLPPGKAAAEQARFDKAVEKQKRAVEQWQATQTEDSKARLQEAAKKANEKRMGCNAGFLKMFDLAVVGTEALNGRTAWIVEMKPHLNAAPLPDCGLLKMFGVFHIKVWVDQEDYRWARFETDNVAPVNYGMILFHVPTGELHALWEQARNEDGVWLVTHDRMRVMAKMVLAVPVRVDETNTYSGYRKYQADSRIVTDDGK
jgi:hypothetical protein